MHNWIKHPLSLKGQLVELIPLEKFHFEELAALAANKKIWEFLPSDCSNAEVFIKEYEEALVERERGNHYPFVIRLLETGKLIGSTRFFDIHPSHRKLEIGWTWLHPDYWGTAINFDCKLLLLTYCFETLKAIRVQLKTSDTNIRSRKAIEKIGGQFEGILRKDRIRANGSIRNSAYYSILDEEWEKVKSEIFKA
ncbi:MAG: GNAT family N-acetyltransferase [Bacteroidetes bacterium B1(2017)]|nr:MAG: GNAT family N-acetyltransferase [Bacteroidetes bacterium B1(2017)]